MKIVYTIYITLFPVLVFSQSQFTNFGNVQIHSNSNVAFYGNFSNSGTFTDDGAETRFNGSAQQIIDGANPTTFRNLSIINTSGVVLSQNTNVSNILDLNMGPLTLNSQVLTVNQGAPSSITRTSGYVVSEQTNNSGRLRWNIGSTTGAHVFPFGKSAEEYIPFTFNLTAGDAGNVTLSTYPTAVDNTPYPTAPDPVSTMVDSSGMDNSFNTVDRFWQIIKDGPSGTATITFSATPTEASSIYQLKARRWNTATQTWEAPLPGQTATATSVTVPNVTNFSPWVLAGNIVPLPIKLLKFNAKLNENRMVDLDWTTVSEINNDYFTVEKTRDLIHYEPVCMQDGAGNSNTMLSYVDLDTRPYEGLSYYRLSQTDYDGTVTYFEPVSVMLSNSSIFDVLIFPNPSTADDLTIAVSGFTGDKVYIKIIDMAGKQYVNAQNSVTETETYIFKLNGEYQLAAGMYLINVSDGKNTVTEKILIK